MFSCQARDILDEAKNVLLCGCGGGYDIYSGMPIYHTYQRHKNKITLANITFAHRKLLKKVTGLELKEFVEVNYAERKADLENTYPGNYVPEYWLSKHLQCPVYAIEPNGVQTLINVFTKIVKKHDIDLIVMVDGGIDSMMFGDEEDIGTFSEDMSTLVAVSTLPVKKMLVTNAWGAEGHISHNRYFENVAKLIRQNGFLGAQFLEKDSDEGRFYISTLEACFPENSTINASIHASITGLDWKERQPYLNKRYPDYEMNTTSFSLLDWIGCPLGGVYWFFDLDKVMDNLVYKKDILPTLSMRAVDMTVHHYRHDQGLVIDGEYKGERNSTFF